MTAQSATTPRDPVEGRMALPFEGAPDWIMWMPGGIHTITASKRGRPVTLRMQVDSGGAAAAQQALGDHLAASPQRPFFDFDHRSEAASAWPLEFAWRDSPDPGIYARVEWSDAGRQAVTGKRYRAFSPKWFETDGDPARVDGAPLNMGGLVNDPAFKEISPIWAKQAPATDTERKEHSMTPNTELAAAQARIAELEAKNQELQTAVDAGEEKAALEASKVELEGARKELDTLKADIDARKRRDADAIVASAVSRGAIPPKDEAAQKSWRELLYADPSKAELLAKLPGRAAVTAGRIVTPKTTVELVKPDTNDILRGYLSASTPRERGALYHREIKPLLDAGENVMARSDRIAMQGSNTLGTLVNAMVSQRTLELVYSMRPMLKGVVTDFSDGVTNVGDTVKTRTLGLPTMQNFGGSVSETADTDVTVTLDLLKEVKYTYAITEYAATSRDLVKEHAEALAVGLGIGIVDAMAALITEGNFGTGNQTIKASASIDFSTITAIAKAMNAAGVPPAGRFAWVDENVAEALCNDELMAQYFDKASLVNAYSHWRNVKGFENIWEYPALPANSCNLTGFFAHRSALIVAGRIPANPTTTGSGTYIGRISTITDPISGLSVLSDEYTDSSWNVTSRLVGLFGVDVGNAAVGHTLVSAA